MHTCIHTYIHTYIHIWTMCHHVPSYSAALYFAWFCLVTIDYNMCRPFIFALVGISPNNVVATKCFIHYFGIPWHRDKNFDLTQRIQHMILMSILVSDQIPLLHQLHPPNYHRSWESNPTSWQGRFVAEYIRHILHVLFFLILCSWPNASKITVRFSKMAKLKWNPIQPHQTPFPFAVKLALFGCLEKNHPNPPASGMPSRSDEDPVPAQFVQLRTLRTDHQFFVPWPGQIYELMSWDAQPELGGFICLDLMKVFLWCFFPEGHYLGNL